MFSYPAHNSLFSRSHFIHSSHFAILYCRDCLGSFQCICGFLHTHMCLLRGLLVHMICNPHPHICIPECSYCAHSLFTSLSHTHISTHTLTHTLTSTLTHTYTQLHTRQGDERSSQEYAKKLRHEGNILTCIHTYMQTCIHAYTHTRIRAYTYIPTHKYTHTRKYV